MGRVVIGDRLCQSDCLRIVLKIEGRDSRGLAHKRYLGPYGRSLYKKENDCLLEFVRGIVLIVFALFIVLVVTNAFSALSRSRTDK